MANAWQVVTESRKDEILDLIGAQGAITFRDISKHFNIHYQTARKHIEKLASEGLLRVVKTEGRTIYWGLASEAALPTLPDRAGTTVSLSEFLIWINTEYHKPQKLPVFLQNIAAALAITYSQPIIAKTSDGTAVVDSDVRQAHVLLRQANKELEYWQKLIGYISARVVMTDPRIYADWWDNPKYNRELAHDTIIQWHPDNAGTYTTNYTRATGEDSLAWNSEVDGSTE